MRKITLEEIDKQIESKREELRQLDRKYHSQNPRPKRKRHRTRDEQIALNKVTRNSWLKAVESGKIRYEGKRKIYYDID
ncbi:MAG TPA: hypothetical protein VFK33_01430 [Bacillales bacterium]|nr:hypothetical protein [Bacillales bacterium]